GVANLELHEGSWFEPVGDQLFDLIVANPPFIVSPRGDDLHRYSGQPGDELCRKLVRAAPAHLRDGGLAHVLCDWVHGTGEDPFEPLRRWVDGAGCDALLLHFSSQAAFAYAGTYAREEQDDLPR